MKAPGDLGPPGQSARSPVVKARGRGPEVVLISSAEGTLFLKLMTTAMTTSAQVSDLINYHPAESS